MAERRLTRCADDTADARVRLERSQAQIADLDDAGRAGNEDVIALEIAVDDGRLARVQEVEAVQQLPRPLFQQLERHLLELLDVPTRHDISRQVDYACAGAHGSAWRRTRARRLIRFPIARVARADNAYAVRRRQTVTVTVRRTEYTAAASAD